MDAFDVGIGLFDGALEVPCYGRNAEDAAAVGDVLAVFLGRTGVEYHDVFFIDSIEAADDIAFMGRSGIAGRSHDDAAGCSVFPVDHIGRQRALGAGIHDLGQVAVEERQDGLRFGIAEAAVEFDDFRAIGRDHQAGIEAALVGDAFLFEAIDDGFQNLFFDFLADFRRNDRCRRISPHAARVGAFIVIEDTLVVLGGNHGHDGLAIDESQEACFFADHTFFNDDAAARSTEDVVFHHGVDGFDGFCFRLGDDDALAGSQAIGLDDDRCALFLNIGLGGFAIGKGGVSCRRDVVFLHEVLGKDFGPFHLGCGLVRAKDSQAFGLGQVGNAFGQGDFRADDEHVDAFVFGIVRDGVQIGQGDVDALGDFTHSGAAGNGIELIDARALSQFPGQSMFAAAAADDCYFHYFAAPF